MDGQQKKQQETYNELRREMQQLEENTDEMQHQVRILEEIKERQQEAHGGVMRFYNEALYNKPSDGFYRQVNDQFHRYQEAAVKAERQLMDSLEASKRAVKRLRYEEEECAAKVTKMYAEMDN